MSIASLIAYAILTDGKEGLREIRASRWLQGLMLLFIIPFVSFFWSEDKIKWWEVMQVKLPLLLMPFCVPIFRKLNDGTRKQILWVLCLMVLMTICYSYAHYFLNHGVNEDYLKAKVLRVVMGDDHVRYASLLVVVYAWLLYELLAGGIIMRKLAWAFLIFLAIFFHVLAARTGLIGFYLVNIVAVFTIIPKKYRLPSATVLLALPLIAWMILPSFQNRIRFLHWDFQNYSRGSYVEGLSDAPRMLSIQAGSALVKSHPLAGTGAGDLLYETHQWYEKNASFLKDYERLLPGSEILIYACVGGLIAGLLAFAVFCMPLAMPVIRKNMLWLSFHITSLAYFFYEIPLELQYGVCIYAFFGIWFFSSLSNPESLKR